MIRPAEQPDRGPRLGILGGGQLALMLAEAAVRQGASPVVLAPTDDAPAAAAAHDLVVGALDDPAALRRLLARVDVVTLENEFLDLARIGDAGRASPYVPLRPGAGAVSVAQDKLAQKRLFADLNVPAAPHLVIDADDRDRDLARAHERFPGGFVLKWSRFGYDGRGNLVVHDAADPGPAAVREFRARAVARGAVVYAERKVDFAAELAMVGARDADGRMVCFPLVESRQERGVCRETRGPATALGFDPALDDAARATLAAVGEALELRGVFAIEFFLDRDGRLLANEMAPRVHNTGHFTLFGEEPSQFDLHVQAVIGRPLSTPHAPAGITVMRNVLGPWDVAPGASCAMPRIAPPGGAQLTWYGKSAAFAGRKLGHVTGRAADAAAADALLDDLAAWEVRYWRDHARGEREVLSRGR
jgi:5-(carboxyamino)imidazole ribonucleotide synthase